VSKRRKPQSRRPGTTATGSPLSPRSCGCAEAPGCGHASAAEQRLAEAIWPAARLPPVHPQQGRAFTKPHRPLRGDGSVWARADMDPLTSTYRLTIEYNDHDILGLGRDDMLDYVAALSDALMRARYTEGVRRQLVAAGIDEHDVLPFLVDLRDEWPDLPRFGQYEIRPCVSFEGRASVDVFIHGKDGPESLVQFSPSNVHEHVNHVLQVYANADLDASYRRTLINLIGLDAGTATAMIGTLGEHLREE
jgi:hypothetical protein